MRRRCMPPKEVPTVNLGSHQREGLPYCGLSIWDVIFILESNQKYHVHPFDICIWDAVTCICGISGYYLIRLECRPWKPFWDMGNNPGCPSWVSIRCIYPAYLSAAPGNGYQSGTWISICMYHVYELGMPVVFAQDSIFSWLASSVQETSPYLPFEALFLGKGSMFSRFSKATSESAIVRR